MEELRNEVAALREDNAKLREMVKRVMPPGKAKAMDVEESKNIPIPDSPVRGYRTRKGTRNVILESELSDDDKRERERQERKAAEEKRIRMLSDMEAEGMPEVIRPKLGGKSALLEAAIPPKSQTPEQPVPVERDREWAMKERIMNALTKGMEGLFTKWTASVGISMNAAPSKQNAEPVPAGNKVVPAIKKAPPNKGAGTRGNTKDPTTNDKGKGKSSKPKFTFAEAVKSATTSSGTGAKNNATSGPGNKKTAGNKAPATTAEPKNAAKIRGSSAWAMVARRRGRPVMAAGSKRLVKKRLTPIANKNGQNKADGKSGSGRRKLPQSAAVTLTSLDGGYEELVKETRSKVNLAELGITTGFRPKRAQTGALIIEIPEDSVSEEELAAVIAEAGGCSPVHVQVGSIRSGTNGLNIAWARCPLAALNAIREKGGKLRVGWFVARVQELGQRLLQCFRCLEGGHVRAQCTNPIDRSERCYRCGAQGHLARECREVPQCPVCADLGRPAGHRAGGKSCTCAKAKAKPQRAAGATIPNSSTSRGKDKMEVEVDKSSEKLYQLPRITAMEKVSMQGFGKQPVKRTASTANVCGETESNEKPLAQKRKKNRGQKKGEQIQVHPLPSHRCLQQC
ncbi:uncharacterized protein LOC112459706 [Temnothorax curvispinosus]|uniref:Uncharacterized protein LOC112459706 n=1 Tax=Temnothorax curvispinosus TaxID=300111 RepID=A0A6J1QEQ5_9HYME|nr:uncharacterized protein LOC112459706 [Temnothorax curvispinosus]